MFSDLRFAVRTLVKSRGFVLVTWRHSPWASGQHRHLRRHPRGVPAAVALPEWRAAGAPVGEHGAGLARSVSEENLLDWQAQNHTLEDMSAFKSESFNLATGSPERIVGHYVTEPAFRLFGIAPALGRTFVAEEFQPGQDRSVVLGTGSGGGASAAIRISWARRSICRGAATPSSA
jgi:hypothetical protein